MKTAAILVQAVVLAALCSAPLLAQEDVLRSPSGSPAEPLRSFLDRTIAETGGGLVIGDSLAVEDLGYSVVLVRTLVFLNPTKHEGFYLSPPSGAFFHKAGKVGLGDTRYITAGVRGAPFAPAIGLDAHLAVTLGSRRIDEKTYGDYYLGLVPGFGIFFPYDAEIDFGVSVEPNINVLRLFGAETVDNQSYVDINFFVSFKRLSRIVSYPWNSETK